MKRKITYILVLVLFVKLILSVYGINWGLPDRWSQDERINAALKIVGEKTFYYSSVEPYHPIVYYYFEFLYLTPYLLILKLTGFDFEAARSAASISWLALTKQSPGFAKGLLIAGRSSSAILGLLTVFLIYLIAKRIFDRKTGIFSALVLTVNVGMLGTNHLIKNENLSLFLIALILYIWSTILNGKFDYKKFYLTCFLSGLAIGTKLDSSIILFGVVFILCSAWKSIGSLTNRIKSLFFSAGTVALGVLLGYPRLVIPAKEAMSVKESAVKGFGILFNAPSAANIINQIKFVFLKVAASYNVLITVFLFVGLVLCLVRLKNMHKLVQLSFFMLLPYYLVIVFLYRFVYTNLLILSFPILSIYAGYGFKILWDKTAYFKRTRAILFLAILAYSLIYAVRADMVFARNDTRYFSTRWIEDNIPPGSSIVIIQDPEQLFSSRIVGKYDVYYYDERIGYGSGYYAKTRAKRRDASTLMKNLSGYDYVVMASWNYMAFETGERCDSPEEIGDAEGWQMVKSIRYDEDLFLNPQPTYTCPAIFIFKTNKAGRGGPIGRGS